MRTTTVIALVLALALAACATENLQGEATNRPVAACGKPTHQYDNYNPDDRTLDFVDVASGATISVTVDELGRGTMVWKGLEYGIQVDEVAAQEPFILMDTNRDGWLDKRVRVGDKLLLPACY